MGKYYGYARVSTKDQSDYSLDNQIKYLKVRAQNEGMEFVPFKEKESGKDFDNRPVVQSILKKIESGDVFGVYDNSRLGRNTEENIRIVKDLHLKGIRVQVDGRFINPDNPNDILMLTIQSAVSTFERQNTLLKSKVGLETKKEKGDWIFTNRLYGYKVTFKGRIPTVEIVEEEAKVLKYIFNEYAKGRSIRSISIDLTKQGYRSREGNDFHPATIRRYILKPIYKGYYVLEGAGGHKGQEQVKIENSQLIKSKYYPLIIEEDLWDRVYKSYRKLTRTHSRQFEHRFSPYELTGILKCYYCKKLGRPTGYVHNFHKMKSGKVNGNYVNRQHLKGCEQKNHTFRASILEKLFRNCFYLLFFYPIEMSDFIFDRKKKIEDEIKEVSDDIYRIQKKINRLKIEQKNLVNEIRKGTKLPGLQEEVNEINDEMERLEQSKSEYKSYKDKIGADIDWLVEQYSDETLSKFLHSNPVQKREFYLSMIREAWVWEKKLIIQYSNTKVYIIEIVKNRGRYVQTVFKIKSYFMGKYQQTFQYDYNEDELSLIHIPYNKEVHKDNPEFLESYLVERKKLLNELVEKISFNEGM